LKATAREPHHRYATAGELADDLRAFLDDRPIRARRASPPERLARWCRRNKLLAGVSAFAAASFLLALVFATVGYVTTHSALQKSDANVKRSLAAFERLFNEFDDPMDAGPFADGVPPDLALSSPPGDGPRGPGKRQAHALKRAITGMPGLGPPPRPPHLPPEDPSRPPRGPMMLGRTNLSQRELALLEIVLDYYDGFAEQNETNSQLPGEAARAYRKVADLYRLLGREPEADKAQARAVAGFESLIRRHGEDSEYRYDLARMLAHDGPASDAVPAERAEPDLRLAIAMVERGFQRAADRKRIMYAAALARWKARLAEHLETLGRAEEALGVYRESIAHDEWLADQLSDRSMVEEVLSSHRAALAASLIRLGRGEEARPLLDRAASDFNKLLDENTRLMPGADERLCGGLESLASSYRSLGEQERAAELAAAANRIRERGHDRRPGRPGGGGPGPGRKGPPGAGRGRPSGPPTESPEA
jgi:tetratricopeptide (TPR) repeat protein